MQDSIQARPAELHGAPGSYSSTASEPAIPVIPSNAEELVGKTKLFKTSEHAEVQKNVSSATHRPAIKSHYGVPQYLAFPYIAPDSATLNSTQEPGLPADSIAGDSLQIIAPAKPVEGEIKQGIVIINPAAAYRNVTRQPAERPIWGNGMSWIYLGLIILFCFTAVKFKGSTKYLKAIFVDLTDTRVRHNVFDETVKETSLLVLMNMMWIVSVGILLWVLVTIVPGNNPAGSLGIPDNQAKGIVLCTGVVAVYMIVIFVAYTIVGNVFSDSKLTRLWLKGAGASSALETFLMFPIALLALNYPAWEKELLIAAGIVFIIGKIIFLYKGFRIFFNQISSWLLFLYYLCSLEIVPLILTYVASVAVCASWL